MQLGSCDSKVTVSIDRMRFGWQFWESILRDSTLLRFDSMTKDPEVEGSRMYQSSGTPLFMGAKLKGSNTGNLTDNSRLEDQNPFEYRQTRTRKAISTVEMAGQK